jgi:hypothetical protein
LLYAIRNGSTQNYFYFYHLNWFRRRPVADLDKKGIRCNAGAVPAAVSLCSAFATSATVLLEARREGRKKRGEPEDLPVQNQQKSNLREKRSVKFREISNSFRPG